MYAKYFLKISVIGLVLLFTYLYIDEFAALASASVFNQNTDKYLYEALSFFIYDSIKILILLTALVYVMALIRANLNTLKVRNYLIAKKRILGYLLGSLFGAITPFCSCSSVPLFIGFTSARIPVGITMSFLITSPILNQVAIVLMFGILGFKITLLYVALGILCGILGGFFFDAIKSERFLHDFLVNSLKNNSHAPVQSQIAERKGILQRHDFAKNETLTIVKRVYKWIFLGVAVGALIHGFIPEDFFLKYTSTDNLLAVPFAVFMGLPLYTNVVGIIPIMETLITKGLPIGTTFAFCLSSVAASIPEFILLKQVMKWPMLLSFYFFLFTVFIVIGITFNLFL